MCAKRQRGGACAKANRTLPPPPKGVTGQAEKGKGGGARERKKKAEARIVSEGPMRSLFNQERRGSQQGTGEGLANARTHLPLEKQGVTRGTTREKRGKDPPA